MNAPPLPAEPPGAVRLHARRCARHVSREAAARCPGCGEFFCRECVVEHDGKLLCATCVVRTAPVRERRNDRWGGVGRALVTAGGVLALWLVFYAMGAVLLSIPPAFHDGTIWKKWAGPGLP